MQKHIYKSLQQILIYFFLCSLIVFTFRDMGMLILKIALHCLDYLQIPEKLTRVHYTCLRNFICNSVYTDWLPLFNFQEPRFLCIG